MKIALIIVIVLAALVFIGWLGLQIQPAPFPAYAGVPERGQNHPAAGGAARAGGALLPRGATATGCR